MALPVRCCHTIRVLLTTQPPAVDTEDGGSLCRHLCWTEEVGTYSVSISSAAGVTPRPSVLRTQPYAGQANPLPSPAPTGGGDSQCWARNKPKAGMSCRLLDGGSLRHHRLPVGLSPDNPLWKEVWRACASRNSTKSLIRRPLERCEVGFCGLLDARRDGASEIWPSMADLSALTNRSTPPKRRL